MLNDLVRYYEILATDENSTVPKEGYGTANVSFSLNIDDNGNLINISSCKVPAGKKMVARPMTVPEPVKGRTNKILPDFLFGNSSYVLGVDNKGKRDRSRDCYKAFKEHNISILRNVNCKEAKAVIKFLEKWDPEKAFDNPLIKENLDEILKGAIFIFRYYGKEDIHNVPEIQEAWMEYKSKLSPNPIRQCLVTGKPAPIAVLHPDIKGIYKGQSMGNKLVSYNDTAYESYNSTKEKKQGLNGPVSEYAAFAYGTALNSLLSNERNKIILGDTTVVFWAESTSKVYPDMFSLLLDCSPLYENEKKIIRSTEAEKAIKAVLESISRGKKTDVVEVYKKAVDENIKFYVLGMSPNAARITVRFYLKDIFGSFAEKIEQHYEDMSIQKQYDNEFDSVPLWRILSETVSKKSDDKTVSAYLLTSLMRAILLGGNYPVSLYQTILQRIHAEQDINYYKASIIKAYLLRKSRKAKNDMYKEVLTLALNDNTNNRAYLLGRLFAVFEMVQKDVNPNIKSTIRDKYFTSACTTPAATFPTLLSLVQHHISKSDYGVYYDKIIGEIMDKLNIENDPFPKRLSLDDQGIFYLGFYHQRNKFYKG
ncbi:MAG: type I-C CRISPR-associated protein Cas8c/Csd1 [Clostridiales bacterium]|nr:type I-C CRISPR-associated protein Cas8c/Csd1 [Clostridiales bacterium]